LKAQSIRKQALPSAQLPDSAAEELQRLGHEQVVVLEYAAVARVRVDAQLGVGQQAGEVERADSLRVALVI